MSAVESDDLWSGLHLVTSGCMVLGQVFPKFHLCLYTTWIGVVPLFLRLSGGFHEARERDWYIMSLQNLAALIREDWTLPRTDYRLKAEVLKGVVFR